MAKKQTRRSISVSRMTYERLKSFCETNGISMSQFVESRVGDFLGEGAAAPEVPERPVQHKPAPMPAPTRSAAIAPRSGVAADRPSHSIAAGSGAPIRPAVTPMTSAAARYAVDPPPPIIKKLEQTAPKAPVMPKADQIFTF